jgi:tryptophanyl-tRNA synthetase
MTKKIILSGMRPTDRLHLGHLLGALSNWKKFQEYEAYYMIADWHALSSEYENPSKLTENIFQITIDYLSAGLDPHKSTMFLQSWVPHHAQMHLILSMIVPIPWLERNPTYKEQLQEVKGKDLSTYGFFGYPVLQAADIVLYKANTVPVGQDQLPHLELCREIVRRFNNLYNTEILIEPHPSLTSTPKLPGLDGRKMSKSYKNAIYLSDKGKELEKKILSMITDPERKKKTDKGHPEVCTVHAYHKIFNPHEAHSIDNACRNAEIGCVECKHKLVKALELTMQPLWEKRENLEKDPDVIWDILKHGSKKASAVAEKTLNEVLGAVSIPVIK